jgi:ribosome-binding protein aMBF1 (putative translation factor)
VICTLDKTKPIHKRQTHPLEKILQVHKDYDEKDVDVRKVSGWSLRGLAAKMN